MTNKKSLKSALLMSGISLLLSGAMLVGTTFAWFTDTAESAENTITAGTLAVDLEYNKEGQTGAEDANWGSAAEVSIFKTEDTQKWEPGKMVFSYPIRIANKGTKALKYQISVNITENEDELDKVIKHAVVAYPEGSLSSLNRETAWNSYTADGADKSTGAVAGEENGEALAVVLYWQPTESDNTYNFSDGEAHSITFSLDVYASQANTDADSLGSQYDKDTPLPADMTQQSKEVKEAVTTGVTDVNDFASVLKEQTAGESNPNDKFVGELTVSEIQYNNDNGKYESTLTFKEMNGVSTVVGICGIVGLLHNAVVAQKNNIDTITIDGTEIDAEVIQGLQIVEGDAKTDPKTFGGNTLGEVLSGKSEEAPTGPAWLLQPLLKWAAPLLMGPGYVGPDDGSLDIAPLLKLYSGDIEGLSGHACDVVITDKLGNAVTYSLEFKIDSPIKN